MTIPIVIAHLGLGGYGIWSIIMTAAAYMRFGSIGIKSAFQKYVAEATGNGDYEKTNKLLSTGCAAMFVLSVAVLIPVAWFSTALAQAAGVPPEFLHAAVKSVSVLALIMVMSNVGAVYEAIVMGGHRIDVARNLTTFFTVAEAIAIVILLHFGYGLFAMASVMAASEVGFVLCCYVSSKRILPQVRVSRKFVTTSVVPELIRFAGSYQLVNVLEVLYSSILPIAILRVFGADASGVYALAIRLVSSAVMLADALLLPILSGGAMVHASGSQEEMRKLITKSFKITLGLCLFPLGFIAVFGPKIVFAWTGRADSSLPVALWLVCAAGFFQSFSILGLVLYRTSGKALLDNIRQVIRIVCLFSIALFAHRWGFYRVLAGLAVTEFIGMVFMSVCDYQDVSGVPSQGFARRCAKTNRGGGPGFGKWSDRGENAASGCLSRSSEDTARAGDSLRWMSAWGVAGTLANQVHIGRRGESNPEYLPFSKDGCRTGRKPHLAYMTTARTDVIGVTEDPLDLISRVATRLNSIWLRRTYRFAEFGHSVAICNSCDIRRSMSPGIALGDKVYLGPDVWLNVVGDSHSAKPRIVIGTGSGIGRRSTISARNEIILEEDVLLAPSVLIMDHSHEFSDVESPIHSQGVTSGGRIFIERNCWLGHGAVIVCNRGQLRIGRNSVVGANAVVTKSFPPYSVIGGTPAKLLKSYDPERKEWIRANE